MGPWSNDFVRRQLTAFVHDDSLALSGGMARFAQVASVRAWLDVANRAVRLEPGSAKNDDGRMVYVTDARVFDRYYIVSPGDWQDVARRLTGTISGTAGRRGGDVSRNFTTSLTGRQ